MLKSVPFSFEIVVKLMQAAHQRQFKIIISTILYLYPIRIGHNPLVVSLG